MSLHSNQIVTSVLDLIGNTPLIRLRSMEERAGGKVEIWAKCEFENPGGSVKDRAARQMVLDALDEGRLRPGKILIDSTSGNTGVAYSMIGAALQIPVHLVMPANVSPARKNITQAYGTKLIYSSELEGSDGAIHMAKDIVAENPDAYFFPNQYANPSNVKAHYLGTGAEIIEALGQRITHFATGIGTTGTIMGTGKRLKDFNPAIEVVAIEPDDAFHGLEGLKHLGSSIVPEIWQPEGIIDRMLPMSTDEAWDAADRLVQREGVFVGHSAGANVAGACQVAREAGPGAVVVTILPDRGDRYFQPMRWEKAYIW
jgi:S-sulfo-L-cysteine synthase (O-acetyl-L-serine-dependent)